MSQKLSASFKTHQIEMHGRLSLALALIARKCRLSIIGVETDVPKSRLRKMYHEYHNCSAPCGPIPDLGCAMISTRTQQAVASLFACLYYSAGGCQPIRGVPRFQSHSIDEVIRCHDISQSLLGSELAMDMTRCWVVARDLRLGASWLQWCSDCNANYLVNEAGRLSHTCPFCASIKSSPRRVVQLPLLKPTVFDAKAAVNPRLGFRGYLDVVGHGG